MKRHIIISWSALKRSLNEFLSRFPIQWFPAFSVLKSYHSSDLQKDWRAGLNVAALAFAQGMACALIAGLPIYYGIIGAIIAPIIGGFFSGSKNTVLGPTNATAILLLSSFMTLPASMDRTTVVCLMIFLVGLFQILGASLQVASLTRFISRSVIVGYVSAASLLIAMNQLHYLLGFKIPESTTFFGIAKQTYLRLHETSITALLISGFTAISYWWVRSKMKTIPAAASALLFASLFTWILSFRFPKVQYLHPISLMDFSISIPQFSISGINAVTSSAVAIAFLSLLENTFMAKSMANRSGQSVDVHQELYGLGMANVACSLTGGMVASGSVTRSGLNWKSGASTMMSGIFSGIFCLIAFAAFSQWIEFIPVCALATIVIIVSINVIDLHSIRTCLRSTSSDAAVLLITFIVALLTPLSFAIFMGVTTSVILFLRKASSPHLTEFHFDDVGVLRRIDHLTDRDHPQISIIHVEGDLFFGASDVFRDEIGRVCQDPLLKVVIVRLKNARHIDASSVLALEELLQYLNKTGRFMLISGVNHETHRVLRRSGFLYRIGKNHLFREHPHNPTLATKQALQTAMSLVGAQQPIVRVFSDSKLSTQSPLYYDI